MLRTLRNWWYQADGRLDLMWSEPLSWLVAMAAVAWIVIEVRRPERNLRRALALAGLGLWMVAAMAFTIYPIRGEFTAPTADRLEFTAWIPLWTTIEVIADSDGYLMTEEQWAAQRQALADENGVPVEEINLDRQVHGPGLAAALKDPIGNIVLFTPLGFLAAFGWSRMRRWEQALIVGATISGAIELSQLLFGLGSLGTVDDVIFNASGALLGLAAFRLLTSDSPKALAASS